MPDKRKRDVSALALLTAAPRKRVKISDSEGDSPQHLVHQEAQLNSLAAGTAEPGPSSVSATTSCGSAQSQGQSKKKAEPSRDNKPKRAVGPLRPRTTVAAQKRAAAESSDSDDASDGTDRGEPVLQCQFALTVPLMLSAECACALQPLGRRRKPRTASLSPT